MDSKYLWHGDPDNTSWKYLSDREKNKLIKGRKYLEQYFKPLKEHESAYHGYLKMGEILEKGVITADEFSYFIEVLS